VAVFAVRSGSFLQGFSPWARWLALCWGSSLWVGTGRAVFAQADPLPTNLEGYQRFWAAQTSAQQLQLAHRAASPEPAAPTGASLSGDPIAPSSPPSSTPPEKALTPEELSRQRLQRLLAEGAAAHARQQAQQAQATPSSRPTTAIPTLDSLRSFWPITSRAADLQVEEQPNEARGFSPVEGLATAQGQKTALTSPAGGNLNTSPPRTAQSGTEVFTPTAGSLLAPQLLERFPLLRDLSPEAAPPAGQGSQIRQQLATTVQRQIPLDPDQVNVSGDVLSYLAEQDVGIAEGNAQIQLADGTRISGERLVFYRRERRLRSEGPFRMEWPPGPQGRGIRQIEGQNLDLDIPGRRAQFENSLVILPGEEPGTKIFVRSQKTTALLGDQIFLEKATLTTSPEPPITHYVQGDRVEVFPDNQVIVYNARVFAGGELSKEGELRAGLQIAYLPLFIYSLRDHQWVLPGRSKAEGVFVKSSWAYRFNEYNFGGLRLDVLQKKGLGLGFVHDYILPIPDSVNYGRAQFYLVTEADEQRFSGRLRLDHNFDFYAANLLGQEGQLRGQLNLNLDNTYRPAGGRNDNADLRLNATFQGDLSTTTLNINRSGSQENGTYTFPLTLSHLQRYGGVPWLQSDLRLDYNQRVSVKDGPDFADARLTLGTQLTPPGWGGTYRLAYRAYSSSNGDTEPRRNFELAFNPDLLRLSPDIFLSSALTLTQEQQPNREGGSGLNFFNRYELRSSLQFNDIQPAPWITFTPGSIDYTQVLYSTPNQESTVSLNPRLSFKPAEWNTIDLRYSRTFYGNNSAPFQTLSASPQDVDRLNASISFFTPRNFLPNVPPGYLAFEDDLPGELPIALTFPDDTPEDLEAIASRNLQELQAQVRNLLRFDTTLGYDFVAQRWDALNANFTWNTVPELFNVQVQTSYDLNKGQWQPIRLEYRGRSSTTFNRDQRSGLDRYEPGISYALQAVYDPRSGGISTYGLDLDATLGTQWQNHWRLRLGLTEAGIRRLEVRRDLRDLELRLAYDPLAGSLRLEGILVAFPSRPVGLTQERGEFQLTSPVGAFSLERLGL